MWSGSDYSTSGKPPFVSFVLGSCSLLFVSCFWWLMNQFAFSCSNFGATVREKNRQKLLPCRQQKNGLLYRRFKHASFWHLRDSATSHTHTPASGLWPLVRRPTLYHRIRYFTKLPCVLLKKKWVFFFLCALCRYDRQKLTLKEIHNTQYVACMNPTAGSFSINPRLQVRFSE